MKTDFFKNELSLIKNDDIREFAELAVNNLPDYFFKVPASSTGKYHPSYSLGDGGLVRHTRAAIGIGYDLLQLEMYGVFTDRQKDLIITAIMIHDGHKQGDGKTGFTVHEHAQLCCDWVKTNEIFKNKLSEEERNYVANMVSTHMGQWNTDKRSTVVLRKPQTKEEKFVHICDYLASRKYLEFKFSENPEVILEETKPFDIETTVLNFGKHKGRLVKDLIKEEPSYMKWVRDNATNNADVELIDYLKSVLK